MTANSIERFHLPLRLSLHSLPFHLPLRLPLHLMLHPILQHWSLPRHDHDKLHRSVTDAGHVYRDT